MWTITILADCAVQCYPLSFPCVCNSCLLFFLIIALYEDGLDLVLFAGNWNKIYTNILCMFFFLHREWLKPASVMSDLKNLALLSSTEQHPMNSTVPQTLHAWYLQLSRLFNLEVLRIWVFSILSFSHYYYLNRLLVLLNRATLCSEKEPQSVIIFISEASWPRSTTGSTVLTNCEWLLRPAWMDSGIDKRGGRQWQVINGLTVPWHSPRTFYNPKTRSTVVATGLLIVSQLAVKAVLKIT